MDQRYYFKHIMDQDLGLEHFLFTLIQVQFLVKKLMILVKHILPLENGSYSDLNQT
jgi:hypothetical protein